MDIRRPSINGENYHDWMPLPIARTVPIGLAAFSERLTFPQMTCRFHDTVNGWGAPPPAPWMLRANSMEVWVRNTLCQNLGCDADQWEVRVAGSLANGTATVCTSDIDLHVIDRKLFAFALPQDPSTARRIEHCLGHSVECQFEERLRQVEDIVRRVFLGFIQERPKALHLRATPWGCDADIVVVLEHRSYTGICRVCGGPQFVEGVELRSRGDTTTPVIAFPKLRQQNIEKHDQQAGGRYRPIVRIMKCTRQAMRNSGVAELSAAAEGIPSCLLESIFACVPGQEYRSAHTCYWPTLNHVLPAAIHRLEPAHAHTLRDLDEKPLFAATRTWSREQLQRFLQIAWQQLQGHQLPLAALVA